MKINYLLTIVFTLACLINNAQPQRYYLVISSHPTESLAIEKCTKLRATGFSQAGYVYSNDANRYRVYLESYNSLETAVIAAKKYKRYKEFSDSWVLDSQPEPPKPQPTPPVIEELNKAIEELRNEMAGTHKNIQAIQDEILNIKVEIQNAKNDSKEGGKINKRLIDQLEEKLDNLNESINSIEDGYVKKTDTIAVSWEAVGDRFDFGDPKFSISFGPLLTHLTTSFDPNVLAYFNFDANTANSTFFGLYFGGDYHFSRNWSTGLELQAYIYGNDFYFFPSVNIKYSQQLGHLPVKLNPFLAFGTEAFVPNVGSVKGARFLMYSPGLDIEWGLNKKVSLFGNGRYNFNTYFNNGKYELVHGQHLNLSVGIRFNIH